MEQGNSVYIESTHNTDGPAEQTPSAAILLRNWRPSFKMMLFASFAGVVVLLITARLLYRGDVTKALGLIFISSAVASVMLSSGFMTDHAAAIALKREHEGINHINDLGGIAAGQRDRKKGEANNPSTSISITGGDPPSSPVAALPPSPTVSDGSNGKATAVGQPPPPPQPPPAIKNPKEGGSVAVHSGGAAAGGCSGCEANTAGPCMHETLPICFPYAAGTAECEPRTHQCGANGKTVRVTGGSKNDDDTPNSGAASAEQSQAFRTEAVDASKYPFVLVTGADESHACPLMNLLRSLKGIAPSTAVVIYDLGMKPPYLNQALLHSIHPNIIAIRHFDYPKYPDWFKITYRAGEYAWKPMIIRDVVDEFGEALWVDSGNLAIQKGNTKKQKPLDIANVRENLIGKTGFYSPTSLHTPWHWVHAGTFGHFGLAKCCADPKLIKKKPCCCCGDNPPQFCTNCDASWKPAQAEEWLDKTMCNGALVGFKKGSEGYTKVLLPWHKCSLDRSCIAPQGPGAESHRGNHRQDQAGLTLISHLNGMPCFDKELSAGFKLHQDNRWQNKTFCEEVESRGASADVTGAQQTRGVAPNAADAGNRPLPPPASPPQSPPPPPPPKLIEVASDVHNPNWMSPPDSERGILTAECLEKYRPDAWKHNEETHGDGPQITHVINPFPTDDVHFSWTMPAIVAAQKFAASHGVRVEIIAITFTNEDVKLPDGWKNLKVLDPTRTAGEYLQSLGIQFTEEEIPLKGPIVKDAWERMYMESHGSTLVWTNFDIIVREDFYVQVHDILLKPEEKLGPQYKSLVGVSILRADVLVARATHPNLDHFTVDDFFGHNNTQKQAGHDSFAFPRHWIPCLDIRHMAFGVGGWDHAIYSQFKQLAHHDGSQFRTIDTGRVQPKLGTTEAPPPPETNGDTGLARWIRNSVRPGYGLTRHLGSQVANVNKFWTNPVSWKGKGRSIQYGANKRVKYEVEVYISAVRGIKNICKRKYLAKCNGVDKVDVIDGLASDGRLIGLAIASPARDVHISAMMEALLGLRVGSVHDKDLTNDKRDTLAALITHAPDLLPGPKGPAIFAPLPPPPRKKGPLEYRAAVIFLEDPAAAISSWYLHHHDDHSATTDADVKAALVPFVRKYVEFWEFWIYQFKTAVIYIEIINVLDADPAQISTEFLLLQEFMMLHRCGRGGSREWRACQGGGNNERKYTGRICCALEIQATMPLPDHTGQLAPDIIDWIRAETLHVAVEAKQLWVKSRTRYQWPVVQQCCEA